MKTILAIIYMTRMGTVEPVQLPVFLSNPWALALYGWLFYNLCKLLFDQKKYDLDDDGLGWSEVGMFFKHEWLGMLVSLMLLPITTPYTPQLWTWLMVIIGQDQPFSTLAYSFNGVWMALIQLGVSMVKNKIESYKNKIKNA